MRMKREMVLWLLALPLAVVAAGGAAQLERPTAGDLVASTLSAPKGVEAMATAERAELSFSWPVEATTEIDSVPAPPRSASREYWVAVSGSELAAGFAIFTTAPGALVRIQPGDPGATGQVVDPRDLRIESPNGQQLTAEEAADTLVTAEQLAAADAPFAEGTCALRLRDELGGGRFVLQWPAAGAGRYVVHVFDRESTIALVAEASRGNFLAGERIDVALRLQAGGVVASIDRADGFLTSPSGRVFPVSLQRSSDGGFVAVASLPPAVESGTGGLWELVGSVGGVRDGVPVLRSTRLAFSVAAPTGRFDGNAEALRGRQGERTVRLGVDAASEGRYEVRGLLYGLDREGRLRPAATGHAAAWLPAGKGALTLRFDAATLKSSGLTGPWELRGLELRDQGRLGLLERRQRALAFVP